jgi:hypothetical protein
MRVTATWLVDTSRSRCSDRAGFRADHRPSRALSVRQAGGELPRVGAAGRVERQSAADADLARVRVLAAYKDFLTLWKDADPDIPIFKQAKAEYAKLQ